MLDQPVALILSGRAAGERRRTSTAAARQPSARVLSYKRLNASPIALILKYLWILKFWEVNIICDSLTNYSYNILNNYNIVL